MIADFQLPIADSAGFGKSAIANRQSPIPGNRQFQKEATDAR
jgi:hypothetical protein